MSREKIKIVCRDCGGNFEATDLGRLTASLCRKCGEKREEQERASEKLAQEQAEEQRYRGLIRLANIPPRWREVRFENSNPGLNPKAFEIAKRYAEKFNSESPSLVFYSPGNGTGKTHLVACIANHILHEKRLPVIFKKARDLMLDIRRTFSDRGDITEADVLDRVLSVQLLVLDDVGLESPSNWVLSTYWTVFDRRLEWELPMVITTNYPIEAYGTEVGLSERIGAGAVSRLIALSRGQIIDCSGPDLR